MSLRDAEKIILQAGGWENIPPLHRKIIVEELSLKDYKRIKNRYIVKKKIR